MSYQKSNPETIQAMFNSIANQYDRTNAVLSFNLHKRWNRNLVERVRGLGPSKSSSVLVDLCAGTGDISFEYLNQMGSLSEAYLVDFCSGMLACAKGKGSSFENQGHQCHFIEADVQNIPLPSEMADFVTMAYGIRNVKNPAQAISEAYRLLKSGGSYGILELTQPNHFLLKTGHSLYLKLALPLLGRWLTSNQEAYDYLRNSIHTFIAPSVVQQLLVNQGFILTNCYPLAGGIATIIMGQKK